MGVLEDILQMKGQGISDQEIMQTLQSQGVAPQTINDAMSQAEIKNAVGNEAPYPGGEQGYQDQYAPQDQGYAQGGQEYYPQEQGGYDQGYESAGMDTSQIIEIAEQVFSEKIGKIQTQIRELSEFKTLMESKIEHLTDRTKRVETIMDKTQMAILDKVGSYGKNLSNVKKEMDMMQDSFGKMVPHLAEKAQHHQAAKKLAKKTPVKKSVKKVTKKISKRR